MKIEIDKRSGFCFGVIKAIKSAENELNENTQLYCLGDIVHNGEEVRRLAKMGLRSISKEEYFKLKNCKVLIRAHGEPPETYKYAIKKNIKLIDATCPVVITLQERVRESYKNNLNNNWQIVIFGKIGHAEIIGLNGQTNYSAVILENKNDISKVDTNRSVLLYSQTTKRIEEFYEIAESLKNHINKGLQVHIKDTICRHVSDRVPNLKKFAASFDMILFVADEKSSNGKYLYSICREENNNTNTISKIEDIKTEWFENVESVGICGATSTPNWLMKQIFDWINEKFNCVTQNN
ncbi:MAG: 4-hydroxy-3-methylbut-2-enyl diphosphate reductase [Bacteroidales bacterium]|jgi:4-hydroxy-3-methylbut-2-enyl diphosphate reductase|nr:4-hydroxy-3-methylbut-2-enyl diphosphate reductase [Bacteroidales bacterium]